MGTGREGEREKERRKMNGCKKGDKKIKGGKGRRGENEKGEERGARNISFSSILVIQLTIIFHHI